MASPGLQRLLDERREASSGRLVDLASGPGAVDAGPDRARARAFVRGFVGTMVEMAGPGTELVGAKVYDAGLAVTLRLANGQDGTNEFFDPKALRVLGAKRDPGDVHASITSIDGLDGAFVYPKGDTTRTPTGHADIYQALEDTLAAPAMQHMAKHHDTLIARMAEAQFDRTARKATGTATHAQLSTGAHRASRTDSTAGTTTKSTKTPRLH